MRRKCYFSKYRGPPPNGFPGKCRRWKIILKCWVAYNKYHGFSQTRKNRTKPKIKIPGL